MRIKYNGFLLSDATAQLRRFPLPEPPSAEEMAAELAGIERLEEALEAINVSPERLRREQKALKCTCRINESLVGNYIEACPLCKAAPELLEHLKDMVRRFEGCLTTNGTDREFAHSATAHARAAIAKAGAQ